MIVYSIIFPGGDDTEGFHLSLCLFPPQESLCQGMLMRCARRRCTIFPGTLSFQPGKDGERSWYLGNFPLACGDYFGRSGELLSEGHCEPSRSLLSAINSFLLSVTQGIAREQGEMEGGCPVQTFCRRACWCCSLSLSSTMAQLVLRLINKRRVATYSKAARETEG
ncbi:unnamed protein product [Ectocarpus sp. 8 AP-2014]